MFQHLIPGDDPANAVRATSASRHLTRLQTRVLNLHQAIDVFESQILLLSITSYHYEQQHQLQTRIRNANVFQLRYGFAAVMFLQRAIVSSQPVLGFSC